MPLTELVHCVTIAFTNPLPFNGDFSFGKSQMWVVEGLKELGDVMLCKKKKACTSAVEWQAHCRDEDDLFVRSL